MKKKTIITIGIVAVLLAITYFILKNRTGIFIKDPSDMSQQEADEIANEMVRIWDDQPPPTAKLNSLRKQLQKGGYIFEDGRAFTKCPSGTKKTWTTSGAIYCKEVEK